MGNRVNVSSKPNMNRQYGGQLSQEGLLNVDGFTEALTPATNVYRCLKKPVTCQRALRWVASFGAIKILVKGILKGTMQHSPRMEGTKSAETFRVFDPATRRCGRVCFCPKARVMWRQLVPGPHFKNQSSHGAHERGLPYEGQHRHRTHHNRA